MTHENIEEEINEQYTTGQLKTLFKMKCVSELIVNNHNIFDELVPDKFDKRQGLLDLEEMTPVPSDILPDKKADLVKYLTVIYTDRDLFLKLMDSLPDNVRKVFELLTWNRHVKADTLQHKLKEKIIIDDNCEHFLGYKAVNPDYLFFAFSARYSYTGENKYLYSLFFTDSIRKQFKEFSPSPEGYNIKPLDEIVETQYLFENQGNILTELPLYIAYIKHGHLKFGKNNEPPKTSLRKMKSACEITEFYNNEDDDCELIRTRFLSNFILTKRRLTELENDTGNNLETFKLLFKQFEQNKFSCLKNFIAHLKGTNHCVYQEEIGKVTGNLLALLRVLPAKQMVSYENICKYVELREINLNIVSDYAAERHLYFTKVTTFEDFLDSEKEYIGSDLYTPAIINPLISASMFFFASLGLVDIAYNKPVNKTLQQKGKKYLTIFDGLEYVRLTELGAYITEQSSGYTVENKPENEIQAILDDQRLIITLTGNDKMKNLLLTSIAEKIGENRYKFSYSSVFRDCVSKSDIEKKIEILKNNISPDLPVIWADFFENILLRYNPLELQDTMSVYKISENKELINLIAKDSILKKYILKVEDFHIVVNKTDFIHVRKRLESLGYLMGKR